MAENGENPRILRSVADAASLEAAANYINSGLPQILINNSGGGSSAMVEQEHLGAPLNSKNKVTASARVSNIHRGRFSCHSSSSAIRENLDEEVIPALLSDSSDSDNERP